MKKTFIYKSFFYLPIFNCSNAKESMNSSITHNVSCVNVNRQVDNLLCDDVIDLTTECKKRPSYSLQCNENEFNPTNKASKQSGACKQQKNDNEAGLNRNCVLDEEMSQTYEYVNNYFKKQKTTNSGNQIDSSTRQALKKKCLINIKKKNENTNNKYGINFNEAVLNHSMENSYPTELPFFLALKCLFKSILYYRCNIGKFFHILQYKIQDEHNKHVHFCSKDDLIREFIELSIQFAKNTKDKSKPELLNITDIDSNETKIFENSYIENLRNIKNKTLLIDSIEYKQIYIFNNKVFMNLNAIASCVEFAPLSNFLKRIFEVTLIVSKYYYMLSYFLESLYNISLIVNDNFKQLADIHVLDLAVFKVSGCSCSEQTKKNFVFHWAFCWLSYFSKNCSLPKQFDVKYQTLELINAYPKEFFVQFIVLVHYNMNIEHYYTETKHLDKKDILILKKEIYDLLFNDLQDKNIGLCHQIIYNLYDHIKDINNPNIHIKNTVYNMRMQKTHQTQIDLMNKLIPAIHTLNKFIYDVTTECYHLTKLKINKF